MKKIFSVVCIALVAALLSVTLFGCIVTKSAGDMVTLTELNLSEISIPILAIDFNLDGDRVYFEVNTVETVAGEVTEREYKYRSGDAFSWYPDQDNLDLVQSFVCKVVVTAEGNIVGYAVASAKWSPAASPKLSYKVVEAKYFPQVNGSYQDITEEYVNDLIEKAAARA